MKLKKIASVALAGVMAVSVLAGCGANAGANSGNTNTETETSTSIVEAVNKGQSAANKVKVTFTSDAKLDNALKTAVEKLGATASYAQVAEAITNMTGLETVTPGSAWENKAATLLITGEDIYNNTGSGNAVGKLGGGLMNSAVKYATNNDKGQPGKDNASEDGETNTIYGVVKIDGMTEEAVMNNVAAVVNNGVAKLSATSDDANKDGKVDLAPKNGYYSYTYDANISMASAEQVNGTTSYFVAIVLNQHVAAKTL